MFARINGTRIFFDVHGLQYEPKGDDMVETKAEISDEQARKFRKKAVEKYGYRKGTMKNALEDMIKNTLLPRMLIGTD